MRCDTTRASRESGPCLRGRPRSVLAFTYRARVDPVKCNLLQGRLRLQIGGEGLMPEIASSKPDAALLDQRVQVVIDQSKAAIEASKETIEKSRELLERMKRAADRPLVPPPHSN